MEQALTWEKLCHLCELAMAIADEEVEIPYAQTEPGEMAASADLWCAEFARNPQPATRNPAKRITVCVIGWWHG